MKHFEVETFTQFHEVVQRYDQRFTMFRGASNAAYELIPKIGRSETRLSAKVTLSLNFLTVEK